jgi:hypothetical protein
MPEKPAAAARMQTHPPTMLVLDERGAGSRNIYSRERRSAAAATTGVNRALWKWLCRCSRRRLPGLVAAASPGAWTGGPSCRPGDAGAHTSAARCRTCRPAFALPYLPRCPPGRPLGEPAPPPPRSGARIERKGWGPRNLGTADIRGDGCASIGPCEGATRWQYLDSTSVADGGLRVSSQCVCWFLSLKIGLYSLGKGRVTARSFAYRGLEESPA